MDEAQEKIESGLRALDLMQNSAFRVAVEHLRNEYIQGWIKAATTEKREEWHYSIAALSRLVQELNSTINTGMATKARIDAPPPAHPLRNPWNG